MVDRPRGAAGRAGQQAAVHGGPRAGAGRAGLRRRVMAGRGELSSAALQRTGIRAESTGGGGAPRRSRGCGSP